MLGVARTEGQPMPDFIIQTVIRLRMGRKRMNVNDTLVDQGLVRLRVEGTIRAKARPLMRDKSIRRSTWDPETGGPDKRR